MGGLPPQLEWLFGRKERWVWSLAILIVVASFAWDAWQARRLRPPVPSPSAQLPAAIPEMGSMTPAEGAGVAEVSPSTVSDFAPADPPVKQAVSPQSTQAQTAPVAGGGVAAVDASEPAAVSVAEPAAALVAGQVVVPAAGPPAKGKPLAAPTPPAGTGTVRVDLNQASLPELDQLPGIGPALAERIIQYRQEKGPFTSIEQLTEVSGIGPAKWDQLRDRVAVGKSQVAGH